MTKRGLVLLPLILTALALGLSTGERWYYLLFLVGALLFAVSLITILWLKATLKSAVALTERRVDRGGAVHMTVTVSHLCPLPVSDMDLTVFCGDFDEDTALRIRPFRDSVLEIALPTRHVGTYACGVARAAAEDAFGLFRCRAALPARDMIAVLPLTFDVDSLSTLPGDEGAAGRRRSQEDYTSPEDVRRYVPGDALKRIHWKLSVRRQELLVRQYETPAPPDALLIMDPFRPFTPDADLDTFRRVCDMLCETVCSLAGAQMENGAPVRVPFYLDGTRFTGNSPETLISLREMLARQDFSREGSFGQVLLLEARDLKKTGAVAAVTSRLTPEIVEAAGRLRRQGPGMRLFYITHSPEAADRDPLVARLQHYLVEVCYVSP